MIDGSAIDGSTIADVIGSVDWVDGNGVGSEAVDREGGDGAGVDDGEDWTELAWRDVG